MADTNCPVCQGLVKDWRERPGTRDGNEYNCLNCGKYFISSTAMAMISSLDSTARAFLSHQMWKNRAGSGSYVVTSTLIESSKGQPLPGPDEQLDYLIQFWGDLQEGNLSQEQGISNANLRAKLGSLTAQDVGFIAEEAFRQAIIDGKVGGNNIIHVSGRLTFKGWQRFRALAKGRARSRKAFMAMSFNDPALTQLVDDYFRPAVAETGFVLRRVNDETPAGLIDNRIRVEIRMSRFLIADLTGGNQGAYWEAGFAEGEDKPVIYTCSEDWKDKVHFDTNHCHTVFWSANKPEKAAEDLKATIRATLPYEAVMPPE